MQDVYILYAIGCSISVTELDEMSQDMIERYMLLKDVADVATYGGTLKL